MLEVVATKEVPINTQNTTIAENMGTYKSKYYI